MTNLETYLRLAGFLHFGLLVASASTPHALDWKQNLAPLHPFLRKLFWVYGVFIVLVIIAFGTITLGNSNEMAAGTSLARWLCGFIGVFWLARLFVQLFIFDARPFLTNWFYRIGVSLADVRVFIFHSSLWICSITQRSTMNNGIETRQMNGGRMSAAIYSALIAVVVTIPAAWLGTYVLRDYGLAIFIGTPFCLGFLSSTVYVAHRKAKFAEMIGVALLTAFAAGSLVLVVGFDGLICLIMASPLIAGIAMLGAAAAYAVKKSFERDHSTKLFCAALLALPLSMGLEHWQKPEAPLLVVRSQVDINASPDVVWRNVVTFSTLPAPTEMLFKTGIAYPIRAEIRGQGVGAVRNCIFSTGPFVEPIETWDEPRLLKFSVTENPPPMREMSPWHDVHPPHLDGFLVSRHGQFRLIQLPNGGTRLEGTTWYQHHLWPAAYWQSWSDYIIHRIHLRVLNHIKRLSEAEGEH